MTDKRVFLCTILAFTTNEQSVCQSSDALSCFHVIYPGFGLLVCTTGKLNDKKISVNFRYIHPILMIHTNLFLIHTL